MPVSGNILRCRSHPRSKIRSTFLGYRGGGGYGLGTERSVTQTVGVAVHQDAPSSCVCSIGIWEGCCGVPNTRSGVREGSDPLSESVTSLSSLSVCRLALFVLKSDGFRIDTRENRLRLRICLMGVFKLWFGKVMGRSGVVNGVPPFSGPVNNGSIRSSSVSVATCCLGVF